MIRRCVALANLVALATISYAQHPSLPSSFEAKTIHSPEGADIFVRWGGTGAVVVLIHGYAENSDSWAPLAADLMKDHTVVVPDLRGIGRSSKPTGGYDKKTQAKDIRAVVTMAAASGERLLQLCVLGFRLLQSQNQKGLRRLRDGERRAACAVTNL
jgi:hypothetical protein